MSVYVDFRRISCLGNCEVFNRYKDCAGQEGGNGSDPDLTIKYHMLVYVYKNDVLEH